MPFYILNINIGVDNIMYSKNEWGQLKKVVVGIADNARIPEVDASLRHINYADVTDELDIPTGKYPQIVVDEANEDLETFADFLRSESCKGM